MPPPTPEQQARLDRAVRLLPPRLRRLAGWVLSTWLGRVGLGTAWSLQRIEIFDRAMAIAAQLFTSVFPMLILLASWFGDTGRLFSETLGMPPEAETEVDAALKESGSTAFGIIGAIIVLASATSLSRALARAFAAVWAMHKPRSNAAAIWRWIAVVLAIALSLIALRRSQTLADAIPPPNLWGEVVALLLLVAVAVFVPWVLLSGTLTARALLPGAVLFGVVMRAVRPFSDVWLARSLEASATRYGSIGVAFTYLAWLYLVAWILLATAVIGQVLVTDQGGLGRRLAGAKPLVRPGRSDSGSDSGTELVEDVP